MIAHLNGIKSLLSPLAYPTHLFAVDRIEPQFLIIEAPGWGDGVEDAVCGEGDDLDVNIRLKAVVGTPTGAAIMLNRARSILSPSRSWTPVQVEDRIAHIRWLRHEMPVTVDRSVTIVNTDRHPGVAVDTYRLVSQPTA